MARLEQYITNQQLNEDVLDWFKGTWHKLKSLIVSLFSKATEDLLPGEEVIVAIPTSNLSEEHVKSGAISHFKGNYNEALVCYIINNRHVPHIVEINKKKFKEKITKTENQVKGFEDSIKKLPDADRIMDMANKGSSETALYLIGQARNMGLIIRAAWVDNLGAIQQGVENKGDIKVVLEKGGSEIYTAYSLKLYKNNEINLTTTTPYTLVRNLLGDSIAGKFKKSMMDNEKLSGLLRVCRDVDNIQQAVKRGTDALAGYLKVPVDDIIDTLVSKYGKYMDQDSLEDLKKCEPTDINEIVAILRDTRNKARKPINPILANLTYDILHDNYRNDFDGFIYNLLKMLGFKDHETKLLIAIQKSNGKMIIIDKHPELNLDNILITYSPGTTTVNIVSQDQMKVIMKFNVNSGEKQNVGSKVVFGKNLEVDMSEYEDLRKILGFDY